MSIKKIQDLFSAVTDPDRPANLGTRYLLPEAELVMVEIQSCKVYFEVNEICHQFFGGVRETDALVQTYADTLARDLASAEDCNHYIVSINKHLFSDNYDYTIDGLRRKYVSDLQLRYNALYAVALECFMWRFTKVCGGLFKAAITKRLDAAIAAAEKNKHVAYLDM